MPRGDRKGPDAEGPMTGRRLGFCVGNDRPGFEMNRERGSRNPGRGYGRGFGFGRGMRFRHGGGYGRYYDEAVPEVSHETKLKNEVRIMKDQLASLEQQLSDLKKQK